MPGHNQAPFAERLLAWWDVHGRKDLPWQHPRTPYRVWVSEIMLQQTQVTTVIPYFERWMTDFPSINTLANASLDDVLAHWAGLGYYARARNLHKTAVICRDQHGGDLPEGSEALAALPGIGLSTANAIVSQSTDQPAAVLDGNVRRVLARHAAIEGWSGKAAVQKKLWQQAELRLPDSRGADYTQAIMDLGATLCKRSKPACVDCPVADDCEALAGNLVEELPTRKPSTRVSEQTWRLCLVLDSIGKVLLHKRPPSGIWGGLWCLPLEADLGTELSSDPPLAIVEHRLSHVQLKLHIVKAVNLPAEGVECGVESGWFDPANHKQLGLPQPISGLLARLHNGELE